MRGGLQLTTQACIPCVLLLLLLLLLLHPWAARSRAPQRLQQLQGQDEGAFACSHVVHVHIWHPACTYGIWCHLCINRAGM